MIDYEDLEEDRLQQLAYFSVDDEELIDNLIQELRWAWQKITELERCGGV